MERLRQLLRYAAKRAVNQARNEQQRDKAEKKKKAER
jgi:hypothetical protein